MSYIQYNVNMESCMVILTVLLHYLTASVSNCTGSYRAHSNTLVLSGHDYLIAILRVKL